LKKNYEILKGLPSYGKMYIPITNFENEKYSEGYVVRFFKKDGTDWVTNFGKGWSNYSNVFEFCYLCV